VTALTTRRSDLEAERDSLLASLRSLDDELADGQLDRAAYAALKDEYTARAAGVLRRLEGLGPPGGADAGRDGEVDAPATASAPLSAPVPVTGEPVAGRRRLRLAVAAAGVLLLAAGAGVLVSQATAGRQAGQPISGSVPLSPDQELAAARHAMSTGDQVHALELFQAVLQVEPNQPEALAYSGWLLRLAGITDDRPNLVRQAVVAEEAAESADSRYPDPYFFLGVILLDDEHQPAAAIPQFQRYLGLHPPASVRPSVESLLARARTEAATSAATPTTTQSGG
jgi:tetratricopeptide (TPR) repeat protein